MSAEEIRKKIALFGNLVYDRSYSVASEGNISYRLGENRFLITPSGVIKKFLKAKDVLEVDMQGNLRKGKGKPTTEFATHLQIYKDNPSVRAIIHAHPFYTVLLTVIGINPFEKICLSEAGMFLKKALITPYARPSTKQGAEVVKDLSRRTNVLVIDRHGSFTYGESLEEAFSLLEILEKYCKAFYYSVVSGRNIHFIDEKELDELSDINYTLC